MKTYHVKHILVQHKYEAEDLLLKIKKGESFENLALKFSMCSSAKNQGDLGILRLNQADSTFEEESLALKINEVSPKPVRTRFGYHIIKRIK